MAHEERRLGSDDLHRLRLQAARARPGIQPAIWSLLPPLEGRLVLHELCGSGEGTAQLAEAGALATGIDVWAQALDVARRRFPGIVFVDADPQALPVQVRMRPFDLVLADYVLGYVSDVDGWARETASALKDGGTLVLVDTHPARLCVEGLSLRWRHDYFAELIPVGGPGQESAVRLWRIADVVGAILSAGLVLERLEELRSLSRFRDHDPRLPGEFALVATRPATDRSPSERLARRMLGPDARPR